MDNQQQLINKINIQPYERRYRAAVNDLLFRSNRVHTHLDWHDAQTWIDLTDVPILLAWHGSRLVGVMAASQPMGGTCWLRIIAIADALPARPLLHRLWQDMCAVLKQMHIHTVGLLIISDWLSNYVAQLGFSYTEDIITLQRDGTYVPPAKSKPPIIRNASNDDLPRLVEVDHMAFVPPWQLSSNDLRQAKRIAATCTVATQDDTIIGYQLSTVFRKSGHLARLAVTPETQGKGIGSALLDQLIRQFSRRGVTTITVNTQSTNIKSQRVYAYYGFERNGYDLPVWMASIT